MVEQKETRYDYILGDLIVKNYNPKTDEAFTYNGPDNFIVRYEPVPSKPKEEATFKKEDSKPTRHFFWWDDWKEILPTSGYNVLERMMEEGYELDTKGDYGLVTWTVVLLIFSILFLLQLAVNVVGTIGFVIINIVIFIASLIKPKD